MSFQAGDKVVHGVYGPGEVLKLDQKVIAGRPGDYYVVQVGDMTIWVPEDNGGKSSLRPPTPADEFERLFSILSSPGEPLLEDRYERKTQLQEKMRDGTLESICRVIRDLSFFSQTKKMNDNDVTVMERAQNFLISEWILALAIPPNQAERELRQILGDAHPDRKSIQRRI